jgi:hypothetical protein
MIHLPAFPVQDTRPPPDSVLTGLLRPWPYLLRVRLQKLID